MYVRLLGVLPMLLLAFAGCLDGASDNGAKAFDAIAAPSWSAGYSWTYDLTSSYHSTFSERGRPVTDSESENDSFTLSVVNDTQEFEGEPVYFVRSSKQIDHPFLRGTMQAITKANLAVAGYAYQNHYAVAERPMPVRTSSYSGYYPPQPTDPCEGVTIMNQVGSDERFPGFNFPLDDGQTWSGSWGDDNDMPPFTYTSKVRGITPVQVPAGVFPSVYMETEFVPAVPEGFEGESLPIEFRIRSESWYSPDVRYLTKMVVSAEATGRDPDGDFGAVSFDFVSTMQLRDFQLAPKPSEPIDVVVQQEYDDHASRAHQDKSFAIVTDQTLPIEVGAGPVTVDLGLDSISDYRGYDGRIQTRSSVPSSVDIDHTTHEVVWMVSRYGDWDGPWNEIAGDSISLTLEEPGRYGVQAHIRPIKCGETWRNYVGGDLTTSLTRTYDVKVEPGLPMAYKLASLPIAAEITGLDIEWTVKPAAATPLDKGHLLMTSPHGQKRTIYSSPYKESYIYPDGDWRLEWVTDQATIGDDIQITIKTVYDPYGYM